MQIIDISKGIQKVGKDPAYFGLSPKKFKKL